MKNTKIKDEGSSATDFLTDVTDVTAVSAREEGRFSSSSNSPTLRCDRTSVVRDRPQASQSMLDSSEIQ
ncbi:hypothetical protein QUB63_17420 [Microcoleus sp. ARI1-B5]|uniref:hypothetical protein n=1 Tax=unclassified Microcoleus TaxID=2642155 RepID=UPI002FD15F10